MLPENAENDVQMDINAIPAAAAAATAAAAAAAAARMRSRASDMYMTYDRNAKRGRQSSSAAHELRNKGVAQFAGPIGRSVGRSPVVVVVVSFLTISSQCSSAAGRPGRRLLCGRRRASDTTRSSDHVRSCTRRRFSLPPS